MSKIFFSMKNVFVCKVCNFGEKAWNLLLKVLSGIVLFVFSALIACGFVVTALIATPVAVVEALLMLALAYVFPVSAAKCWNRWRERRGCKYMGDAIVFYINNDSFEWHYPVAKEVFMFLTSWVKSVKFAFNPYFVEQTELYIWPDENQIRWYKELHKGDRKAIRKLSVNAFMKMWNSGSGQEKLDMANLMNAQLPEEAFIEFMRSDNVNWKLVSDWFMRQCRSSKAVNELMLKALQGFGCPCEIAKAVVLRNGLPQAVIADLLAKKDSEVARILIAANTNYEYIVMLKSSVNYNLSAILESCKKLNPEFDGFDSCVEMYLDETTYKIYHDCGYSLKAETVKKMLASDNMSLSLFKEIVDNEPMFKDLASLDEDVKTLLQSKMKYLSKLV